MTVKRSSWGFGFVVGYSRKRVGRDGKPRYTAYYQDLADRERSAGTFATKRDADRTWQRAEALLAEGRLGDPRRGRQAFQRYVEDEWLPNHVMEPTTRESYTYSLGKHILPHFGRMRMVEIIPAHVREWVLKLHEQGVSPAVIKYNKMILSGIFTTALNDQVTFLHPCKGVKTPTVPVRPRRIVTPEQFNLIHQALPDDATRLLVETAVESGLRWGELTELRVKDLDFSTRILTVSRAVVEIDPKYHPQAKRFLVKDYPKDKEYRRLRLSEHIVDALRGHAKRHGLGSRDLLFSHREQHAGTALQGLPDPGKLGLTDPNDAGRQYRHGTLSAYSAGRCRCRHCKDAYAIYRAKRRAAGRDDPRQPRTRDTDGHIPRQWFRTGVWAPARHAAGLDFPVRVHDLRHAHASWLLAGGADLQVVKERLGHGSIATTEKYLHSLPNADQTALDALARIRGRH